MDSKITEAIHRNEMIALIPARSGSKGVKDKNLQCVQGYPLLAYAIAAAAISPSISRILVSTDSREYAEIAAYYGAEAPFLRPAQLALDTSPDIEFVEHAIQWLYQHEGKVPEYFIHLRCTFPVRDKAVVEEAVRRMKADPLATSLRSAHKVRECPYKWFNRGAEGYLTPLIKGMTADKANMPRQGFEPVYAPDGNVDVLRTEYIISTGLLHGDRVACYLTPDGVDVDELRDLERLEDYLQSHSCDALEYLRANFRAVGEGELIR